MYKEKIHNSFDDTAAGRITSWKQNGEKIVFTNGCFDILHSGHIQYLYEASTLGDKLVVGLNSDESVKRLKGENRPVKSQQCRADILAALEFVDMVVVFEEDTPEKLIRDILPDVLVKGGDWEISAIVGSDIVLANGGTVKSLDYLKGYSSTAIIERILKDKN